VLHKLKLNFLLKAKDSSTKLSINQSSIKIVQQPPVESWASICSTVTKARLFVMMIQDNKYRLLYFAQRADMFAIVIGKNYMSIFIHHEIFFLSYTKNMKYRITVTGD